MDRAAECSSIRPSTRVSSYGLDSTMNFDALSVQHYKEVRGERKKKRNTVQRSMATATTNEAGKDRNKQGAGDCSKPRPAKNAGLQQA